MYMGIMMNSNTKTEVNTLAEIIRDKEALIAYLKRMETKYTSDWMNSEEDERVEAISETADAYSEVIRNEERIRDNYLGRLNRVKRDSYDSIKTQMKIWRMDYSGEAFPKEYIGYHHRLAELKLYEMQKDGWTIVKAWTDVDGWMDGMIVLHAEVISPSLQLKEIRWSDNHHKGSFYENLKSGGAIPLR